MNMVRHSVDLQNFVAVILNQSCDVLIQLVFPVIVDDGYPVLNRKNSLNMNLCVGICHGCEIYYVCVCPVGRYAIKFIFRVSDISRTRLPDGQA